MAEPRGSYWDKRIETMPRPELREIQLAWLQWQLRRCYEGSAFYRARLDAAGLHPDAVHSLEDLRRLPPLQDEELAAEQAAHPPYGRLAVAPEPSWRTTFQRRGSRSAFWSIRTEADEHNAASVAARLLWQCGARPGDVLATLDEPDGLLEPVVAEAGERLGCSIASVDAVPPGASTLAAAPLPTMAIITRAGASRLAPTASRAGPLRTLRCAVVECLHVAGPPALDRPSNTAALAVFDGYGPERFGALLAVECPEHAGLHWAEDQVLLEVLDPATQEPLPEGQAGVLAVTTLVREATPLLRFWTAERAALVSAPCACGRTSARSWAV